MSVSKHEIEAMIANDKELAQKLIERVKKNPNLLEPIVLDDGEIGSGMGYSIAAVQEHAYNLTKQLGS